MAEIGAGLALLGGLPPRPRHRPLGPEAAARADAEALASDGAAIAADMRAVLPPEKGEEP